MINDPVAYIASLCVLQGVKHEIRDNGNTLYLNGTVQLPTGSQIRGKAPNLIIVDDLIIRSIPRKAKKAQWKNERSVFNRVNQGKKSK